MKKIVMVVLAMAMVFVGAENAFAEDQEILARGFFLISCPAPTFTYTELKDGGTERKSDGKTAPFDGSFYVIKNNEEKIVLIFQYVHCLRFFYNEIGGGQWMAYSVPFENSTLVTNRTCTGAGCRNEIGQILQKLQKLDVFERIGLD